MTFKSIKTKLFIVMGSLILISLLIVTVYQISYFYIFSSQSNHSIQTLINKDIGQNIQRSLDESERLFGQWKVTGEYLLYNWEQETHVQIKQEESLSLLKTILEKETVFSHIMITNKQGQILTAAKKPLHQSETFSKQINTVNLEQISNSEGIYIGEWKKHQIGQELNLNTIRFSQPLYNSMDEIEGYMVGYLDWFHVINHLRWGVEELYKNNLMFYVSTIS